jgi:hypothetical protein
MKRNFIMGLVIALVLVFAGSPAMAHTRVSVNLGFPGVNLGFYGHHAYAGVGYGWYGVPYYYAPPERVIVVHDYPPTPRPHRVWVPGHSFTDGQHIVRVPGHWELVYPDDEPSYLDRPPQDRYYDRNKDDDHWNDRNDY